MAGLRKARAFLSIFSLIILCKEYTGGTNSNISIMQNFGVSIILVWRYSFCLLFRCRNCPARRYECNRANLPLVHAPTRMVTPAAVTWVQSIHWVSLSVKLKKWFMLKSVYRRMNSFWICEHRLFPSTWISCSLNCLVTSFGRPPSPFMMSANSLRLFADQIVVLNPWIKTIKSSRLWKRISRFHLVCIILSIPQVCLLQLFTHVGVVILEFPIHGRNGCPSPITFTAAQSISILNLRFVRSSILVLAAIVG